jgi:AcrR family transcriptional regulator
MQTQSHTATPTPTPTARPTPTVRPTPTARPTGRDEVRAAVLDAAGRHFAAHGANASLRDIAADAGVNLGLIHRHFGNKDDLLQAVLDTQRRAGADLVDAAPDATTAVREIFEETIYKDQHVRTLAWLLLDDEQGRSLRHEYPAIAGLRAKVGDDPDERVRLMAAFTMVYGWTVFGPQLLEAFGYSAEDRAAVESRLADLLDTIVTPTRAATAI